MYQVFDITILGLDVINSNFPNLLNYFITFVLLRLHCCTVVVRQPYLKAEDIGVECCHRGAESAELNFTAGLSKSQPTLDAEANVNDISAKAK